MMWLANTKSLGLWILSLLQYEHGSSDERLVWYLLVSIYGRALEER